MLTLLTPSLRPLCRRLFRRARSLRRSQSGLAMVEFAVSLPVLLGLGLVGLETANYALAHLRISNIAATVADNAARVRDSIDEGDVTELLIGGLMTGRTIDFEANGRIILSSLEPTPDGTKQWIRWQRCDGDFARTSSFGRPLQANGTAITNGTEIYQTDRTTPSTTPSSPTASTMTAMGVAGKQIAAQAGTAVMVVEVVYRYQPLMANSLLSGTELHYLSAFNVRQRTNQSITNGGRSTPAMCS